MQIVWQNGHVKQVCIKSKLKENKPKKNHNYNNNTANSIETENSEEYFGVNQIIDIYSKHVVSSLDAQKFFIKVNIENKEQRFEVDSGAGFTLLPENDFKKLNLKAEISKTNIAFRAYTGDVFVPLGVVNVNVKYGDKSSNEEMYIVSSEHTALLGRVWIRHLKINLADIDQSERERDDDNHQVKAITQIERQFAEIFQEKVGCIPGFECSLKLHKGAKPVFIKERQVFA